MTYRERVLRSIKREAPNSLVVESSISPATWKRYKEELIPVIEGMPNDFTSIPIPEDFNKMPVGYNLNEIHEDTWGCVWHCGVAGMQGIIKYHPLQDGYDALKVPDPHTTSDLLVWNQGEFESFLSDCIRDNRFIMCGGERLWERVHFLRGFEKAMLDLAYGSQEIKDLIYKVADYNIESIKKFTSYTEVDCIVFQDDWGEQNRLMVSPEMWREHFFDSYCKVFQSVKEAGKYVYFHSDGYILPIVGDIIEAGADIINLQSGCHSNADIYDVCHKKVCVSVDIDRQHFMPYGTSDDLKKHISDIYYDLKGIEGGVWVKMDVYPDVPISNIVAMQELFAELRADG